MAPFLQKSLEGSGADIMIMFADLSRSVKDVVGTVDSRRDEMKENVKSLEDQMKEGFMAEGARRRKDNENLKIISKTKVQM